MSFLQTIRKTLTVAALASVTLSGVLIGSTPQSIEVEATNLTLNWSSHPSVTTEVQNLVEQKMLENLNNPSNYQIASISEKGNWGLVSIIDTQDIPEIPGDSGDGKNILYVKNENTTDIIMTGESHVNDFLQNIPNNIISEETKQGLFPYEYQTNQVNLMNSSEKWRLPWKGGVEQWVIQGYNGNFSHGNTRALDFTISTTATTDIVAAKTGTVYLVRYSYGGSGNYVVINHGNNVFSYYLHLKDNSIVVAPGQKIYQGDKIGIMGNTGFSTQIHLDFRACKNIDPAYQRCHDGYPGGPTIDTPFEEVLGNNGIPTRPNWYTSQNYTTNGSTTEHCRFTDIANHELKESICWAKDNDLMGGTTQNGQLVFQPENTASRSEVANVANRFGLPMIYGTSECTTTAFSDTADQYANNLKCHDIANGTNNQYLPTQATTRGEANTILKNTLTTLGFDNTDLLTTDFSTNITRSQLAEILRRAGRRMACGFDDVHRDSGFKPYICNLKEDGIVSGQEDENDVIRYYPEQNDTRGVFAHVVKTGFGLETNTACGDFNDVTSGAPFYESITTLKCLGIVNGQNGSFNSMEEISRSEAATILIRARNAAFGETETEFPGFTGYSDVQATDGYYNFVMRAGHLGIFNQATNFNPAGIMSRGATAKVVDLARCQNIADYPDNCEVAQTPEPNPVANVSLNTQGYQYNGDFNGDGHTDQFFRNKQDGSMAIRSMVISDANIAQDESNTAAKNAQLIENNSIGSLGTEWNVVGIQDMNNDGKDDIVFLNSQNFQIQIWMMNGAAMTDVVTGLGTSDAYLLNANGDFNGDGYGDFMFIEKATGNVWFWFMNLNPSNYANPTYTDGQAEFTLAEGETISAVTELNGDGKSDVTIIRGDQTARFVTLNGTTVELSGDMHGAGIEWEYITTGDFDGNGTADQLLQNRSTGEIWMRRLKIDATTASNRDAQILENVFVGTMPTVDWGIVSTGDFNNDGKDDIEFTATSGQVQVWLMDGAVRSNWTLTWGTDQSVWYLY